MPSYVCIKKQSEPIEKRGQDVTTSWSASAPLVCRSPIGRPVASLCSFVPCSALRLKRHSINTNYIGTFRRTKTRNAAQALMCSLPLPLAWCLSLLQAQQKESKRNASKMSRPNPIPVPPSNDVSDLGKVCSLRTNPFAPTAMHTIQLQ